MNLKLKYRQKNQVTLSKADGATHRNKWTKGRKWLTVPITLESKLLPSLAIAPTSFRYTRMR